MNRTSVFIVLAVSVLLGGAALARLDAKEGQLSGADTVTLHIEEPVVGPAGGSFVEGSVQELRVERGAPGWSKGKRVSPSTSIEIEPGRNRLEYALSVCNSACPDLSPASDPGSVKCILEEDLPVGEVRLTPHVMVDRQPYSCTLELKSGAGDKP